MVSRSTLRRRTQDTQVPYCINDQKTAKYMIYSDDESLYYCEKCAILLASKGFSVEKLSTAESMADTNPRKEEVNSFMNELEGVVGVLEQRKSRITGNINQLEEVLKEEEARVEDYYAQFFDILEEHKRRVLEELREEFDAAS